MARAFVALALALFAAPGRAAEFYVSPAGNDGWSGALAAPNAAKTDGPFATAHRAQTAARASRAKNPGEPVTVHFREGRFELPEPLKLAPEDSGAKGAPLVFAASKGERAVLSGGTAPKVKLEGGVWLIPVPGAKAPIRHISVGGELRTASRWPKTGTFTIAGLAGADPKANYRTPADKFEFAEGQFDPKWKNLSDVEVVVLHFWVAGHYRVKGLDEKSRVVTLDRPSIRRFTEDGSGAKPARFYLLNVPDLEPGEFQHDRGAGVVRYRPKGGETPEKQPVVVPRLDSVVQVEGKPEAGAFVEHVEFRGLTFSDTVFDTGTKSAGDLQAAQHVPGSVKLRGARHCEFTGCAFSNLGGYALELADGCRDNRVAGNEVSHCAAGGVRMSGGAANSAPALRTGANTVTDNTIHHLGAVFPAGVGILSQHADNNRISHNHIHHLYYTAISVGWVWGYAPSVSEKNTIEANRIHDIGQKVLSDMGGIYMLGTSPGTVVRGNVLHNIESFGYGGWGIYTDEGSTGITIENNLVYRTKSGGFHQHYGKENVVRNNIFALAREGQLMRTRAEPHLSFTFEHNIVYANGAPLLAKNWKDDKFALDSNLYWDAGNKEPAFPAGTFKDWQTRGFDKNSLVADPLFMDVDKNDFRLKPNSPAEKVGFRPFDTSAAGVRPKNKR